MGIELKTLATGTLKAATTQPLVFNPGDGVLYAAPHTSEPFKATVKKAAVMTKAIFFNRNASGQNPVTINIYFVRYNSLVVGASRPRRRIMPVNLVVVSGQVITDQIPLTLEPGDALMGDASSPNVIDYCMSGFEQLVI